MYSYTPSVNTGNSTTSNLIDSGVSSISSAESDLVDGLHKVFRRRSSFDKGVRDALLSKKNNRSASVSTPLHQHLHLYLHNGRSSDHHDNVRMKNYQRLTSDESAKGKGRSHHNSPSSPSPSDHNTQSLLWETRQVKTLKAGTLSHIVRYILFLTPRQLELQKNPSTATSFHSSSPDEESHCQGVVMEEERNNVSHVIHVLFVSYRIFATPVQLFQLFHDTVRQHLSSASILPHQQALVTRQFHFILHYWLNSYPEDFLTLINSPPVNNQTKSSSARNCQSLPPQGSRMSEPKSLPPVESLAKTTDSISSSSSRKSSSSRRSKSRDRSKGRSSTSSKEAIKESNTPHEPKLVDLVLTLPSVEDGIYRKALAIIQDYRPDGFYSEAEMTPSKLSSSSCSSSSSILELDTRFIAQQLTAIDLETFLSLKPYYLLEGTRSNPRVQQSVRNFNVLSRQVIISILKSPAPDVVTGHWIEVSLHLRRMKNFNSLKAVISGLTNESIFRLKNTIWAKLGRTTLSNFKILSDIVDDVNNQTVLRQTQLEVEGTAKVSLQEDYSFGTIPYLGTFFTDLTFIDTRYPSTIPCPNGNTSDKMINLEKCSKQFEVLTQVHLLQKNVRAALIAHNAIHNLMSPGYGGRNHCSSTQGVPVVPRVARLFRSWFSDEAYSSLLSEAECFNLSKELEPPLVKKS